MAKILPIRRPYVFRGNNREFWRFKGQEAMISGPYETGKTITGLSKIVAFLLKYPRSRGVLARRTYKSCVSSGVVTLDNKILAVHPNSPYSQVRKYGGTKPDFYEFPNGSTLVIGGMDNPDKLLSAEFDIGYVIQAEELDLEQWEKLLSRITGRAGNAPYAQLYGDCNPRGPKHWILHRPTLKIFNTRHKDNPSLWDEENECWTKQGERTMATLMSLTGTRLQRGYYGKWVAAAGAVYEMDFIPDEHIIENFEIPAEWPRYRAIDFGVVHPFVCLWAAVSPDGIVYIYREIYMTNRTTTRHAATINRWSKGERILATICDHSASDRATLSENDIPNVGAKKAVTRGIDLVKETLAINPVNNKRGIYFFNDTLVETDPELKLKFKPTCTVDEFPEYMYADSEKKDSVIPINDHGLDTLRYLIMHLFGSNLKNQGAAVASADGEVQDVNEALGKQLDEAKMYMNRTTQEVINANGKAMRFSTSYNPYSANANKYTSPYRRM